jgi:hypothetical protein
MISLAYAGAGLLVIVLTSLLKKDHFSRKTNQAITTVLSIIGGIVTSYFQKNGTADLTHTIQHTAYVGTVAQLVYSFAYKDTTVEAFLDSIHITAGGVKKEDPATAALQAVEDLTNKK